MDEKLLWFNEDIEFMFHKNIVEYDMVAASVSVSERFDLLDKETIQQLKLLPKEKRTKRVGMIQRDDKLFSEQLISGIIKTRRKFVETNCIAKDDILSFHSDAIIFSCKGDIINEIDGIKFKHSKSWSGYVRYKGIEMFYDDGCIEYKGIPKDMLNQHTIGIQKYLRKVFTMLDNYDEDVLKYLSKFQKDYLQDNLPNYYYIPFGKIGSYKLDNFSLFAFIANLVLIEVKSW